MFMLNTVKSSNSNMKQSYSCRWCRRQCRIVANRFDNSLLLVDINLHIICRRHSSTEILLLPIWTALRLLFFFLHIAFRKALSETVGRSRHCMYLIFSTRLVGFGTCGLTYSVLKLIALWMHRDVECDESFWVILRRKCVGGQATQDVLCSLIHDIRSVGYFELRE